MLGRFWLFIHGTFVLKLNLDLFRYLISTGKVFHWLYNKIVRAPSTGHGAQRTAHRAKRAGNRERNMEQRTENLVTGNREPGDKIRWSLIFRKQFRRAT